MTSAPDHAREAAAILNGIAESLERIDLRDVPVEVRTSVWTARRAARRAADEVAVNREDGLEPGPTTARD